MRPRLALLALVAACLLAQPARAQVILGILEDSPGDYYGAPNTRDVRVVFKKTGLDWTAYPGDCPDQPCLKAVAASYPPETTWTITFDGKKLGEVTGRTPQDFAMYSRVGQQEITSKAPVPAVGNRSIEFSGEMEKAAYRPLVAVSQPNFKDPEAWRPAVLTPGRLAAFRQQFRQRFPRLCKSSETDESKLVPFPYSDEQVSLVKAYASRNGWTLARLHLEAIDCEDTEAGFNIDDPWFVMDPTASTRYLDSGMFLVDAGDYDGDGRSEVVFSLSSENRGGYRIYYDGFSKHAEFQFSYH
ncbi:MAG TPA: hypothetical protein VE825_00415 [Terriglobales bacterium]|jgi:hypothetical protein|nr:hypothetical protein [Terriglobales bacterium]